MICIGTLSSPSLRKATPKEFRCEPNPISWESKIWDGGNGCLEKCVQLAHVHGPGCCEARWRGYGAFCRFGKGFAKGYSDSKATMLIGK